MSTRERCHTMLDGFSESVLAEVVAFFEAIELAEQGDNADMDFCVSLFDEAEKENGDYSISSLELARKYGL